MTKQAISPLRQRMIEEMAIRKLSPKTQHDYVQRVKDFAAVLLQCDARSARACQAPVVHARATQDFSVLSPEEVARFLEAAPSIKYKAALSVGYGAGLRVLTSPAWNYPFTAENLAGS